jgi:hypothetical protein
MKEGERRVLLLCMQNWKPVSCQRRPKFVVWKRGFGYRIVEGLLFWSEEEEEEEEEEEFGGKKRGRIRDLGFERVS